jgi:hypothetical protein
VKDLPLTDGTLPYRYWSDGTTYVLLTVVKAGDQGDGCPADRPQEVAGQLVYCLRGDGQ